MSTLPLHQIFLFFIPFSFQLMYGASEVSCNIPNSSHSWHCTSWRNDSTLSSKRYFIECM